jgi:hypothetical protein
MPPNDIGVLAAIFLLLFATFLSTSDVKYHRIALALSLVSYIALILLRAPSLLSMYRLWAECGTLYFTYAYKYGPVQALLNPTSNYFDLSANVASAMAVLAGLRWWPLIDTGLGYLAALAVPLAIFGSVKETRFRVALLLGIAVAVCCVSAVETFGTVLHNKGWGAVYAAIALAASATGNHQSKTARFLLFVTPFTGTPALFLLVIWAAGAIILRKNDLLRPLAYCVPGVLTQIVFFLLPAQTTGLAARHLDLQSLVYVPYLSLLRLLVSTIWPKLFFQTLSPSVSSLIIAAGLYVALVVSMLLLSIRNTLWLLMAASLGLFAATALLALGGSVTLLQGFSGLRYYFPSVAILIACAVSLMTAAPRRIQIAMALPIIAACCLNLRYDSSLAIGFWVPQQPSWKEQVAVQAAKPDQLFTIYPSGWTLGLPQCGAHHC